MDCDIEDALFHLVKAVAVTTEFDIVYECLPKIHRPSVNCTAHAPVDCIPLTDLIDLLADESPHKNQKEAIADIANSGSRSPSSSIKKQPSLLRRIDATSSDWWRAEATAELEKNNLSNGL